jgi:ADP-ribosyl-[dinitrogen reductase] hydrolase
MLTRRERVEGGVVGLLVADALGVPYETHEADEIPPAERVEMTPPAGFAAAHPGTPPGTWSDDGALALCLFESLLAEPDFDAEDFGGRLVAWRRDGYLAVDGRVFDVGIQTQEALSRIAGGTPAASCGLAGDGQNGNGALMRALPLAILFPGDDRALIDAAHRQSRVTHAHPRSEACCALYVLWARRTLEGASEPWRDATVVLRRAYAADPTRLRELEEHMRPDLPPAPSDGSSYVVETLRGARWAVAQGPFETAVKKAVSLGGDTDATACVAGGVAGLRDGVNAIPRRWRDALRGGDLLQPLLKRVLEAAARGGEAVRGASIW